MSDMSTATFIRTLAHELEGKKIVPGTLNRKLVNSIVGEVTFPPLTFSSDVHELRNVTDRTAELLYRKGIETVAELLLITEDTLRNKYGISDQTATSIINELSRDGYQLLDLDNISRSRDAFERVYGRASNISLVAIMRDCVPVEKPGQWRLAQVPSFGSVEATRRMLWPKASNLQEVIICTVLTKYVEAFRRDLVWLA